MAPGKQSVAFDKAAPSSHADKLPGDVERGLSKAFRAVDKLPAISAYSSFTAVNDSASIPDYSTQSRIIQYFQKQVDTTRSNVLLIACSFISGVIDSAAFNAWGSFTSMQTGNMVFLTLRVSGQPPEPQLQWAKSLIAMAVSTVAVLFFTHLSRLLGPSRRSTLLASFMLQNATILASCILLKTGVIGSNIPKSAHGIHWLQMVPIALLAFQAAGQIVTSRMVHVEEIPTVVLTTVLADLFIDPRLIAKTNTVRNRRVAMILALFGGAMLSGGLTKVAGLSCSLWLAAGIKGAITICWALWRAKVDVKDSENGWR